MDQDESLRLTWLRGGPEGIKRFNESRKDEIQEPNFSGVNLSGADLRGVDLAHVDLQNADLSGAHLIRADLNGSQLINANLCKANLSQADLSTANFGRANLQEANLRRANLRETELPEALLSKANFQEAVLCEAQFRGADLRIANLSRVNLSMADLSGANLQEANLRGADLSRANLFKADLSKADLGGAGLITTNLIGTVLTEAKFVFTIVACDLAKAKGLANIDHRGPSQVSMQTICQLNGDVPENFLRGCGLSPWEIKACKLHDKTLSPMQIADIQNDLFDQRTRGPMFVGGVFISYSHSNSAFVDMMYEKLWDKGANVWLDRHDMVAGPIEKQVFGAIRMQDIVLIVLSEDSIKSDWVEAEIEAGRKREQEEHRDILCPVALDDSWKGMIEGNVLWRQVAKKNILDFSKWEDGEAFQEAFAKLLRGMKIYYTPGDTK